MKGELNAYVLWPLAKSLQNWNVDRSYCSRLYGVTWLQTDQGALLSKVRRDYRLKSLPNDDLSNYFWHGAHTQLETSTEQKETTTVMSLFLYN